MRSTFDGSITNGARFKTDEPLLIGHTYGLRFTDWDAGLYGVLEIDVMLATHMVGNVDGTTYGFMYVGTDAEGYPEYEFCEPETTITLTATTAVDPDVVRDVWSPVDLIA